MQSYAPEDVWSLRPLCALCMTPFPTSSGAVQLSCYHVFCMACAQESACGPNLYQCPFEGTQGYLSNFDQNLLQQTEYVIANIQEARNPSWGQFLYQLVTDLRASVNFFRVVCRDYCSSGACTTTYNCPYDHTDMSIRSVPCPLGHNCGRIQVCPYSHQSAVQMLPVPQQMQPQMSMPQQMGTQLAVMPQMGPRQYMGASLQQMGTQMTVMPQLIPLQQMGTQMTVMPQQMPLQQMGTQMTVMPQQIPLQQMGTQMTVMPPQIPVQPMRRGLSPADLGMAAGQQGAVNMQTTNIPPVSFQATVPQGLSPADFGTGAPFCKPGIAQMMQSTALVPKSGFPAFSPNAPPGAIVPQRPGFAPSAMGYMATVGKIGMSPAMMPPAPQVLMIQAPQPYPPSPQPQGYNPNPYPQQYNAQPHAPRRERPQSHFQYHRPTRWYQYGQPFPTDLQPLTSTDKHYKEICDLFHKTSPGKNIVKIEQVRNYQLYTLYAMKHESFSVAAGRAVAIKRLFHGTRTHAPKLIYESMSGLDSRVGTGMWGQGTYYAVNSSYSVNYAHPLASGDAQMFCCSVIVGDFVTLPPDPSLRKPPPNPKGGIYHSIQGNTGGSDIFITYEPAMSYPTYLITFKP